MSTANRRSMRLMRLFFATDLHGSDICWKKFLNAAAFYGADILVLGGDMTGKAMVPITQNPDGTHTATLLQQGYLLRDEEEIQGMERRVGSRGYYPFRTTPEQLEALQSEPGKVDAFFQDLMMEKVSSWMALAAEKLENGQVRCFVCPGNDDGFAIDEVIRRSSRVVLCEGEVVDLGEGFGMASTGWSNVTPWETVRELTEEAMEEKLTAIIAGIDNMERAIFNFHCPPYGSNLDEAPEVDDELNVKEAGRALIPVGSTAVRDVILKHQPALSLHGHIHEGKGTARLGRTLAINPGSLYEQGVLQGAVIDLDRRRGIRSYTLTTG